MECVLLFIVIFVLVAIGVISLIKKINGEGADRSDPSITVESSLNYMPDGWIQLEDDLWLSHSKSEKGDFILAWSSGAYDENGKYLLSHRNTTMCSGNMAQPAYGNVADNGTFVLMDCTGGLTSRFYAFTPEGTKIMECAFRALPFSTGVSASGSYAVVQTCNAPSETDGCALVFFDLVNRKECWRIGPDTGWSDAYRFDDELAELVLVHRKFGSFRYSYENGEFLDLEKWERRRLSRGDGGDILGVCRERFLWCSDEISDADVRGLQDLVKQALEKQDIQNDDRAIAKTYRLSGEIYEAAGNLKEAIEQYKTALGIDEKVGVKMRLQRLQKKIK